SFELLQTTVGEEIGRPVSSNTFATSFAVAPARIVGLGGSISIDPTVAAKTFTDAFAFISPTVAIRSTSPNPLNSTSPSVTIATACESLASQWTDCTSYV